MDATMTERRYRSLLTLFVDSYWGTFHEVLEAQSVTPARLAGSLYDDLLAAHARFAALGSGVARPAVDALDRLWRRVSAHRTTVADAPLTAQEISEARAQLETVYDALVRLGRPFTAVRRGVLSQAAHGNPRTPLRADAAR
jgi:hypothetical protein